MSLSSYFLDTLVTKHQIVFLGGVHAGGDNSLYSGAAEKCLIDFLKKHYNSKYR